MVDPFEPDDGGPVLPPGPRRSTYTPPPAGAQYEPGSLVRDAVPLPTPSPFPAHDEPELDDLEADLERVDESPVSHAAEPVDMAVEPTRVVWHVETPQSAPVEAVSPHSAPSETPFSPEAAAVEEPGTTTSAAPPPTAAEQLGLPSVPPPPTRVSLSDDDLAAVLDPAAAPPGSTAELIDLFEQQLTMRAEEAQRLALWERAVRESGVPRADELVESVRSAFTGIIDVVPPAVDPDDPWARYPGASTPPATSPDDREPLVLPPVVAPASGDEAAAAGEPTVSADDALDAQSAPDAPTGQGLTEALASFPPPFGLVPSAVVPPPIDDAQTAGLADGDAADDASSDSDGSSDSVAPETPIALDSPDAATEPPPLVEPPLVEPPLIEPWLVDPPLVETATVARATPAAPLGAPTGPIMMSPAAVAAAALGFDELLRSAPAAPSAMEPAPELGLTPAEELTPTEASTPVRSASETLTTGPTPSGSLRAVPVADSGARSNPPALRVEASALEPTPVALRAGRSIRLFWLWFAVNASIVSVGLGGVLVGLGMSLRQAILSALVGVAMSFLPLGLGTLAGKWSGQPTMVVSRATFGIVGNLLPAILAVVTRLLWAAVLLGMLGTGATAGLRASGLAPGADPLALSGVIASVGLVLAAVVAGFGYGLIAIVAAAASILAGLLVVLVIVLTAPALDMGTALAIPDGDWSLVLTGAVIVFSLVGLAWANSSGDLARYQAKGTIGAGAVLFASLGATVPSFALIAWGAALASSDPQLGAALASDPIGAVAGILPAGLGLPLAVALSLLAAAALALYSGGFALLATGLRTSRPMGVLIGVVLTGAIAAPLVAAAPSFDVLLRDVLTTVAVPVAAWAGIFGAETMIRTRRVHSPSLLQSGGVYPPVRWVNTVTLIVASIVGWGFTSASLAGLDAQGFLWGLVGASAPLADSDAGVIVALLLGLLTPIAVGIPAVKRLQAAEYQAVLDS
jgi:nucleobase:cation symporter-1, NCS1 family